MSLAYERVVAHLDRLKLRVADLLGPLCEQARNHSWSYLHFLDLLLEAEASSSAERRLLAKDPGRDGRPAPRPCRHQLLF